MRRRRDQQETLEFIKYVGDQFLDLARQLKDLAAAFNEEPPDGKPEAR